MAPKQEKWISDYYFSDDVIRDDPRTLQDKKERERFLKFMKLCEIEKPKNWRQHSQTLYDLAISTLTEYYQEEGRRKTSHTLWSRIVACGVHIHHNPRGIEVSELPDEEYMQWEDRRPGLSMHKWDLVAIEACVKCSMCRDAKRKCEYAYFSLPGDCRCCQLLGLPCSKDYCNSTWRFAKPNGEFPLPQPVSNAAIARMTSKGGPRPLPAAPPPKKRKPASPSVPATKTKVKAKTPKVKAAPTPAPVPAPVTTSAPNVIFARKRRPEDFMDPAEIEEYESDKPVITAKKPAHWFHLDDREPGPSKRASSRLDAIHKLINSSGSERSVVFLEKLCRKVLRLPEELQDEVRRTYGTYWAGMVALDIYDSAGFTQADKQESLDGEGKWPLTDKDSLGTMVVRNWDLEPKMLEEECSACKASGMPCEYQYHVRIQGKTPSTKCRFCAIGKRKCDGIIVMDEPGYASPTAHCGASSGWSTEDAPEIVRYATSEDDCQTRVESSPSVSSQGSKRKRQKAGVTSSEVSEVIVISDDDDQASEQERPKKRVKKQAKEEVLKTATPLPPKKRKARAT